LTDFIAILTKGFMVTPITTFTPLVPTLNSALNDLTGTSITLNITPPATGAYSYTQIYYRIMGAAYWTVGPTYTGVQGVAGNKQITGLTNESNYEFYCCAYSGDYFSNPSAVKRVFCTDDSDTAFLGQVAVQLNALPADIFIQPWDPDKLPAFAWADSAIIISSDNDQVELFGKALRMKHKICFVQIRVLVPYWLRWEQAKNDLEVLTDLVVAALDMNDLSGAIDLFGDEICSEIPVTIVNQVYISQLITLKARIAPWTD